MSQVATTEATSTTVPCDRDALRRRQAQVLADLLAGRVPDGFDPVTSHVTGRVLRGKRRKAAVAAMPELKTQPDLVRLFDEFSRRGAARGCAHDDADDFARWAEAGGRLAPSVREAWRVRQVDDGERRWAIARRDGGRLLVVGIGDFVYEVPLWPGWTRRTRTGH